MLVGTGPEALYSYGGVGGDFGSLSLGGLDTGGACDCVDCDAVPAAVVVMGDACGRTGIGVGYDADDTESSCKAGTGGATRELQHDPTEASAATIAIPAAA